MRSTLRLIHGLTFGLTFLTLTGLPLASPAAAADAAWVLTTDYSSFGRLRGVELDAPWSVTGDLATTPGDAVGRHHGGKVYVVGRAGSNILQVYAPDGSLEREFSLGAGRNPQDIAFDTTGEAYVSCYDTAELLRVDVSNETVAGVYSTAAWADTDGLPETAWMTAVDDVLYITAQKLDRDNWYSPVGPGLLLVFDMATETFGTPVQLVGADPYTRIEQVRFGGAVALRVGCAGFFGVADGGIEAVDPVSGLSLGYVVTEAELGGDVTAFASTGPGAIQAVISDAAFLTHLVRRDTDLDQTLPVASATGYHFADVAADGRNLVFLCDRNPAASGLRVFDAVTGTEYTNGPVGTGLPPFMLVMPEDSAAPAPLPTRLGGLSVGAPFPNPCNPRAEVQLDGRPGATVRVSVCDLRGHRLWSGTVRLDDRGHHTWTFLGQDAAGRSLPAGVYRIVAQSATGFAARTVTLIK